MHRCLISFGANLGEPATSIREAAQRILDQLRPHQAWPSQLYRTPAVGGPPGQGDFLNAVMALELDHDVEAVAQTLRNTEYQLGRQRIARWEARVIDLDLLLYDDLRMRTDRLDIPHPRMALRSFILQPACDVAGSWRDPVTGKTIEQLAAQLKSGRPQMMLISNTDRWLVRIASAIRGDRSVGLLADHPIIEMADADLHVSVIGRPSELVMHDSPKHHGILVSLAGGQDAAPHALEVRAWEFGLGLSPDAPSGMFFGAPRYLIPPSQLEWAVHEIQANIQAMRSFVEPTGEFLW